MKRTIALAVTAVFILGGCAAQATTKGVAITSAPTSAPATTEPAAVETTTEPPAPSYGKPAKGDFKLTPKVLSKKCFGSAGCNVTYRIIISYTGPDLDPAESYEVVYEVRGGEDGAATNTFTVTDGESSVPQEEFISTKSSKAKLTAVATDVL